MSGLTVKTCFERFPKMEREDMIKLLGTENYDENTAISAQNVAHYSGNYSEALSIFYAKNDTNNFIPMLNGTKQKNITEKSGINPEKVSALKHNEKKHEFPSQIGHIQMGTSVFDIYKNKKRFA